MAEIRLEWKELNSAEKLQAIESYAYIRECEEGKPCDMTRAYECTPWCKGFYKDIETGYIFVDI